MRPRTVYGEIFALYVATLLAIRIVVDGVQGLGLPDILLAAVPVLFMYTPVWSCRLRGADPDVYPTALPPLRDPEWREALRLAVILAVVVFVPFVAGYHVWQTMILPWVQDLLHIRLLPVLPRLQWIWPSSPITLVAYHLFFVAIPEEMFYRGYIQSRLDEVHPPRWRVFGTLVGPGLIVTSILFALGHSFVVFQWWHVFIVVPSLAFGWLRARTGGIIAGAFFHAWCNVAVSTLDTLYGIVPPG